jgi:Phosphoribosylformylglycinamidine (FGAM) synthase, synthetase domain
MIESYSKLINESDDLREIVDVITEDRILKKELLKYLQRPYDADVERIGKGIFTLGISKAETSSDDACDAATAITIANNEALAKLACTGARYLTTKNTDDMRINVLGLFKSSKYVTPMAFDAKGDTIYLVGEVYDDSDYQLNNSTLEHLVKSIEDGLITSAHYISSNGLFCSLLESCAPNSLGFDITGDAEIEDKDFLFGKSKYMAIVTVSTSDQENTLVDYLFNNKIPITLLGHVTRGELRLDELSFGHITDFLPE